MTINLVKIEAIVRASYKKAQSNIEKFAKSIELSEQAISDTIPGYNAKALSFGSFDRDNFAVLFADMRNSTIRAQGIGPEKTFTSMHAFIPGLLAVVEEYDGYVIDIMGDGVMVFFGGKHSGIAHTIATQNAGLCARDMISVTNQVVNKVLDEDKIWRITLGAGVDYGHVIVTKIGTENTFDTKAYGDCINKAAKYAQKMDNEVWISPAVEELWPSSKGGGIKFKKHHDEGYILTPN